MTSDGDRLSKDLSLGEFRQFRDYIHQHSGIYLEESKLDSLRISLVTRATRLDCQGWDAYFAAISSDEREFKELLSLITINETSFFRFPAQFDALRDRVIPEICHLSPREDRVFRVWSAGCSTGEEPYTIAMTLADSTLESVGWRPEVLGTDVSTKALGVARAGVYATRHLLNLSEEVVARNFIRIDDDSWRIAPRARNLVEFGYHNLIKEPYPLSVMGNWDVIFCRNVTIYFKLESTRRVVQNFYNSLNEGGYLFVGHSETLTTISDDFEPVETGGVFLYRKKRRPAAPSAWAGFADRREATGARAARSAAREPEVPAARRVARAGSVAAETAVAAELPPAAERSVSEMLAEAHERLASGDTAAALVAVHAVLAADRSNAEAHLVAAQVHADTGDYERAVAAAGQALAINPLMPGARYVLGLIHQRQGDTVRAVSELKKTIYIEPDFVLAHLQLGNIYKVQARYDAAIREYDNALRALYANPEGDWTRFLGGWKADVVLRTCERSLLECRKAMGVA